MNIQEWKEKSENSLSEVEKEAKILLDRIEKRRNVLKMSMTGRTQTDSLKKTTLSMDLSIFVCFR